MEIVEWDKRRFQPLLQLHGLSVAVPLGAEEDDLDEVVRRVPTRRFEHESDSLS